MGVNGTTRSIQDEEKHHTETDTGKQAPYRTVVHARHTIRLLDTYDIAGPLLLNILPGIAGYKNKGRCKRG
ncbi:MAG: hypothetical protein ACOCWH_05765, partial [Spirochaetota bacterium]